MGASNLDQIISRQVNELLKDRHPLKLLEAGCGSASHFRFANISLTVGIDISPEQLERNRFVQEKILGDLQTYPLPSNAFDIVVCWDVIEHLSRPRDALLNIFQSVKPGGVLVLGFPNLLSFKGLATKLTPYWFHQLFYRWMKYKSRPFPTYLRLAILPERVVDFAQANGFTVVFRRLVEGGMTRSVRQRVWFVGALFAIADTIVRVISLGKSQSLYLDNCVLILQKVPVAGCGPST
jgi:SAM-dependent methyltransferase